MRDDQLIRRVPKITAYVDTMRSSRFGSWGSAFLLLVTVPGKWAGLIVYSFQLHLSAVPVHLSADLDMTLSNTPTSHPFDHHPPYHPLLHEPQRYHLPRLTTTILLSCAAQSHISLLPSSVFSSSHGVGRQGVVIVSADDWLHSHRLCYLTLPYPRYLTYGIPLPPESCLLPLSSIVFFISTNFPSSLLHASAFFYRPCLFGQYHQVCVLAVSPFRIRCSPAWPIKSIPLDR